MKSQVKSHRRPPLFLALLVLSAVAAFVVPPQYMIWCLAALAVLCIVIMVLDELWSRSIVLRNLGTTDYETQWQEAGIDPKILDAMMLYLGLLGLPSSRRNFVNPNQTLADFAATICETEIRVDTLVGLAMDEPGLDYVADHGITQDMTFIQVGQRLQVLVDLQKERTSGEHSAPNTAPPESPPGPDAGGQGDAR